MTVRRTWIWDISRNFWLNEESMAESCPSTNFRAWERERRSRTRRVELVGSVKQFLGSQRTGSENWCSQQWDKCVVSLSIDQRFKPRHIEDYRSSWNHRAVSKEHMRTLQPPYTSGSNTPDPVPAPLTHCSASLPDEHADRCTGFQDVLAPNGRRTASAEPTCTRRNGRTQANTSIFVFSEDLV